MSLYRHRFSFHVGSWVSLWLLIGVAAQSQTRRALLIGIGQYAPPAGAVLPVPAGGHAADSRFAPGTSWVSLKGPLVDVASMQVLLQKTYDFTDIRLLTDFDATRDHILAAMDKLVADSKPGDLIVFYYAGHGSLRRDTLSSKNHLDETIVPVDAWKGAMDIRDKEIAVRFNQIVYDKHAKLTAIYDSCHSGTMARGIESSVQRTLPYDDRDVALDKKKDPATITEADLTRLPQKGDAIIIAAADSTQSAVEAKYPDDHEFHGAFTRALVRVLQTSTQTLSAEDVVAEVSSMLHADPVPFQQPSVEGQVQESLFGAPVASHSMHVRVTSVSGSALKLDVGSAAGFDVGTQFRALDPGAGGTKTVIEVKSVDQPLVATAQVVSSPGSVKVGQSFELISMVYPQAARLLIFAPKAKPVPTASAIAKAKALFPGLTWVDDPALKPVNYIVFQSDEGWVAYDQSGKSTGPDVAEKGAAFLLLAPAPELVADMQQKPPFQSKAFSFTDKLSDNPDYLLATRVGASGATEYALLSPVVLAAHKQDSFISTEEDDADDAALNGGVKPGIVCRNDVSLPVRTAWLHETFASEGAEAQVPLALTRRIVRLGKLRVWEQSPGITPGVAGWPYHLAVYQPGTQTELAGPQHLGKLPAPLSAGQHYDIRLVATPSQLSMTPPVPKHVYLFGFDCSANPFLLYPPIGLNGEATMPQPDNGNYPTTITLPLQESVSQPIGADTLFLMATEDVISTPSLLTSDGVLQRGSRGASNAFDLLISDMGDSGSRGPQSVPSNWVIQQLVIPSRP